MVVTQYPICWYTNLCNRKVRLKRSGYNCLFKTLIPCTCSYLLLFRQLSNTFHSVQLKSKMHACKYFISLPYPPTRRSCLITDMEYQLVYCENSVHSELPDQNKCATATCIVEESIFQSYVIPFVDVDSFS